MGNTGILFARLMTVNSENCIFAGQKSAPIIGNADNWTADNRKPPVAFFEMFLFVAENRITDDLQV